MANDTNNNTRNTDLTINVSGLRLPGALPTLQVIALVVAIFIAAANYGYIERLPMYLEQTRHLGVACIVAGACIGYIFGRK